jgi:hypothetical protein
MWTLQMIAKMGNAKAGRIYLWTHIQNIVMVCQIDIEVWTSEVFTRTKQRIGFPLKDRQYYLTALLDVAAKILRKC